MNQLLQTLFFDYDYTEIEYMKAMFSNEANDIIIKYINGIVVGKFRERDKQTLQAIRLNVPHTEIKRTILESFKAQRDTLIEIDEPDFIRQEQLKNCNNAIADIEVLPLEEWIYKYLSGLLHALPELECNDFLGFIYVYYAYEEYKRIKEHACNNKQPYIDAIYSEYFDKSSQFQKYGLLPIDKQRELLCLDPPRLYDKEKNKTIFLKNIPLVLANKLSELVNAKKIRELAVRGSDSNIFDGRVVFESIMEEIERGKIFTLSELGKPEVTKLYSKNYEDCLWVVIDSENITFEELCQDFKVYEEKIVTQVIHLQYTQSDKDTFINHLDHEYIFYTIDEFGRRCQNPEQKGNASTRMKSFKIDNSNISFDLYYKVTRKDIHGNICAPKDVPFLYYVLDCYFQHKDLLYEYFHSVI